MSFDPSLCAYVVPGGQVVRLAGASSGAGQPAALTVSADRVESIYTLNLEAEGGDSTGYNLEGTRWRIEPAPVGYGAQDLTGPRAVFRPDASPTGTASVTAYVPTVSGAEVKVPFTLVYAGVGYIADIRPLSMVRGGETAKIEAGLSVGVDGTYPVRLVRIASPGVPVERTILREEMATFPTLNASGNKVPTLFSETITYPVLEGLGGGYEYVWEIDVDESTKSRTRPLPLWVLGTDPSCAPVNVADEPVLAKADYPSIYTRKASDSGTVVPPSGKTYADCVARATYWLKSENLTAPLGGPWASYAKYYANLFYVDLDAADRGEIPKYTIEHWDQRIFGYTMPGWYGDDLKASPYPRSRVAVDVPIPNNARPSSGTDRSLAIVGMRGGKVEKIWEMWLAQKRASGKWECATMGVTNWEQDWRHSANYTTAASGISALAYSLKVREAQAAVDYVRAERAAGRVPDESVILGMVPHTLALNLPKPYSGGYSYPATHTDGTDPDPCTPMEGQLIYLKSTFDVAAQNYPPLRHVVGVVLKHRGAYVTDQTAWNTTLIVEGDLAYGGGLWSAMREPNESWAMIFPDSEWVVGKRYTSRAQWDADTTV